jgi:hypothetical protein
VDRACPECGRILTPLEDVNEHVSAGGRFLCSPCQIAYVLDAIGELREVE